MSLIIEKIPENSDDKFEFLKSKLEGMLSKQNTSFPFIKPEIEEETLDTLRELSNFWEVYYYTNSVFFRDPNSVQILSSKTFLIRDIKHLINKYKGKLFVFYSAKGSSIRGEFIESTEAINRHREETIDKLLD